VVPPAKRIVDIIQSETDGRQFYVGLTSDLERRLIAHNQGLSRHTSKFRPWIVRTWITFMDEARAVDFERYLKSGTGRAFANRHLR
jgi:predicted GIY-YIG superfamily endonuclease